MADLRVAVLCPLRPQRSGIAEYCAALLPALARHVDVTVVVEDTMVGHGESLQGVAAIGLTDYTDRREDWDVAVYHMGNHFDFHHWIYRELLNRPGLAVLHDLDLSAFFDQLSRHAPELARPGSDGIGSLATVVECSRAVIVHSQSQAELVASRFPAATVIPCELAGVSVDLAATNPTAILQSCGWDSEHFIVGAFGGIVRHKRIDLVIRAVAALHPHEPQLRLLVAGWVFDPDFLDELEGLVTHLGLDDVVRFAADPDDLDSCMVAVDLVIDLRAHITGATSATVMNSLATGRPVVVPDLPMFAQIDTPGLMRTGSSATDAVVDATHWLRECLHNRLATRRRGESAAQWVATGEASVYAVAARHASAIGRAHTLPDPPPSIVPVLRRARRDVVGEITLVGDLTATTGLMEFGRSLANVLDEAGFALDHWFRPCVGASHSEARDVRGLSRRLPRRRDAAVELWLPNVNEFVDLSAETLRPPGSRRRVIAVWFWELPALQAPFVEQVSRVDEIWVGSPFIARSMRRHTNAPVVVIPAPIHIDVPVGVTRRDFGLHDEDTIYYFDFDANSTAARKNPFALVEAFRRAFADGSGHMAAHGAPRLVIKGTNFHEQQNRRLARDVREQLASIDGVLIDIELDRSQLNGLLACADVYVSLHRAEGLGLGMLEAMYLGKPVVSPAYPHKWLFSLAEAGCAVRSPLRAVRESDHPYFPESVGVYTTDNHWADPDVSDAAKWIRLLYDDPALRRRIGRNAASLVRQHYGPAATLAAMVARLASEPIFARPYTIA